MKSFNFGRGLVKKTKTKIIFADFVLQNNLPITKFKICLRVIFSLSGCWMLIILEKVAIYSIFNFYDFYGFFFLFCLVILVKSFLKKLKKNGNCIDLNIYLNIYKCGTPWKQTLNKVFILHFICTKMAIQERQSLHQITWRKTFRTFSFVEKDWIILSLKLPPPFHHSQTIYQQGKI